MQAQFDRNGFVILRDVLPSSVVDTMANSVNEYIARRGPMLTSRSIAFPGYLVLGVHREPPLYHLFEWLHGSRSLHAALAHIFDRDSPAPTKHGEGHGEGPKGYRMVSRTELTIDRGRPWHQDGVAFHPYFGDQVYSSQNLLNAGLYLQEDQVSLEVVPKGPGCHSVYSQTLRDGLAPGLERPQTLKLRAAKGDVIIFSFRMRHQTGDPTLKRREVEPDYVVPHRTLLNIGYGPDTHDTALVSRGFELRDMLIYDNVTYQCGFSIDNRCAQSAAKHNWRRWNQMEAYGRRRRR